jgi:hypothetical protein
MIPIGMVTTKSREKLMWETLNAILTPEMKINIYSDLKPGLLMNHLAAWAELFKLGDRALLLQDDIVASLRWRDTVELFARKFNVPAICFYSDVKATRDGLEKGWASIKTSKAQVCDVALLLKKSFFTGFMEWFESYDGKDDDTYLPFEEYVKEKEIPVVLCSPSDIPARRRRIHDWILVEIIRQGERIRIVSG